MDGIRLVDARAAAVSTSAVPWAEGTVGALGVDVEHASRASKALVPASKVDGADAILAQHGSAHDAGLDGDIEIRVRQGADGLRRQDARQRDELGVARPVQRAIRLVGAASDDGAVPHKDTADRRLVALQRKLGLSGTCVSHGGGLGGPRPGEGGRGG